MIMALCVVAAASVVAPPSNLVVFGPGNTAVQMLVTKLAQEAGYRATAFIKSNREERSLQLMYGGNYASTENPARLAWDNSQMGMALGMADAIVLCAETGGYTGIANTLAFAPRVSRIALLTSIGGSKGKGGNMGEAEAITMCELQVAKEAAANDVELSIVRVGALKGGGGQFGLDSEAYYQTLTIGGYDTPDKKAAIGYDKAVLGATVSVGDGVQPRNAMRRSASRTLATPEADELSRRCAADALLASLRAPQPLEFSVSAAWGEAPPASTAWDEMLDEL